MLTQIQRSKVVEQMLDRLKKVLDGSKDMKQLIDLSTKDPSSLLLQELVKQIQSIQKYMEEIGPRVEQFEEEAIFYNQPQLQTTRLNPNTSAKLGELQHAIIQQIELIDGKIQTGFRYTSYNKLLSKKMQYVNNVIDSCIKNIEDSKI